MSANRILFPDLKAFGQVFPTWTRREAEAPKPMRLGRGKSSIGPTCLVSSDTGWWLLYVEAPAYIVAECLDLDLGDMTYRVVIREDGTALIMAQYNQILGDRWIAIVDAATVPGKEANHAAH